MPSYGTIRRHLLDIAGQDTGSDFDTMLSRSINNYYRILQAILNQDEAADEVSITTAASTSQYGLPLNVLRVLNIDDGTNNRQLTEISARDYDAWYPGTATSGSARSYYPLWRRGVQVQPSEASTLVIVSSAAADASNRFVRIQGMDSNGIWQDEKLTLNGTTNVTSSTTFAEVRTASTSTDTGFSIAGTITITDGSTTLARIPPSVSFADHLWIEFYPIPDATATYTVRTQEQKPDLINDDDWPQIDERWHQLLIDGPGQENLPSAGKNIQAGRMAQQWDQFIKDAKRYSQHRPNRVRTFMDVQSTPRPFLDRPLIPNVDFV